MKCWFLPPATKNIVKISFWSRNEDAGILQCKICSDCCSCYQTKIPVSCFKINMLKIISVGFHKLFVEGILSYLSIKYFLIVSLPSSRVTLGCNPTTLYVTSILPLRTLPSFSILDRKSQVSSNPDRILEMKHYKRR